MAKNKQRNGGGLSGIIQTPVACSKGGMVSNGTCTKMLTCQTKFDGKCTKL
jgi:hypothetical protein